MKRLFIVTLMVAPLAFACTPARQMVETTPRSGLVYMAAAETEEVPSQSVVDTTSFAYRKAQARKKKVELAYQPVEEETFRSKELAKNEKTEISTSSATPYELEPVETEEGIVYKKAEHKEVKTQTNTHLQNQRSTQRRGPAPQQTNIVRTADFTPLAQLETAQSEQPIKMIAVIMSGDKMVITDEAILEQWEEALEAVRTKDSKEQAQSARNTAITSAYSKPASKAPQKPQTSPTTENSDPFGATPFENLVTENTKPKATRSEHPQDMLLETRKEQTNEDEWFTFEDAPKSTATKPVKKDPKKSYNVVTLAVSPQQSVTLDEHVLAKWENALEAKRQGRYTDTNVPAWLLQGLEWLTHAPSEGPVRSEMILPLYDHLKSAGYLDDVNERSMTPVQVVAILRTFVDEMKDGNGQIRRG